MLCFLQARLEFIMCELLNQILSYPAFKILSLNTKLELKSFRLILTQI